MEARLAAHHVSPGIHVRRRVGDLDACRAEHVHRNVCAHVHLLADIVRGDGRRPVRIEIARELANGAVALHVEHGERVHRVADDDVIVRRRREAARHKGAAPVRLGHELPALLQCKCRDARMRRGDQVPRGCCHAMHVARHVKRKRGLERVAPRHTEADQTASRDLVLPRRDEAGADDKVRLGAERHERRTVRPLVPVQPVHVQRRKRLAVDEAHRAARAARSGARPRRHRKHVGRRHMRHGHRLVRAKRHARHVVFRQTLERKEAQRRVRDARKDRRCAAHVHGRECTHIGAPQLARAQLIRILVHEARTRAERRNRKSATERDRRELHTAAAKLERLEGQQRRSQQRARGVFAPDEHVRRAIGAANDQVRRAAQRADGQRTWQRRQRELGAWSEARVIERDGPRRPQADGGDRTVGVQRHRRHIARRGAALDLGQRVCRTQKDQSAVGERDKHGATVGGGRSYDLGGRRPAPRLWPDEGDDPRCHDDKRRSAGQRLRRKHALIERRIVRPGHIAETVLGALEELCARRIDQEQPRRLVRVSQAVHADARTHVQGSEARRRRASCHRTQTARRARTTTCYSARRRGVVVQEHVHDRPQIRPGVHTRGTPVSDVQQRRVARGAPEIDKVLAQRHEALRSGRRRRGADTRQAHATRRAARMHIQHVQRAVHRAQQDVAVPLRRGASDRRGSDVERVPHV